MKIFKIYYLRWFLCAFLGGVIVPPLLFFFWLLFMHFSTAGLAVSSGQPVVIVTNPFVDIINPTSGKAVASGTAAIVIVVALCGLGAGLLGLAVAGLNRLIRKAWR